MYKKIIWIGYILLLSSCYISNTYDEKTTNTEIQKNVIESSEITNTPVNKIIENNTQTMSNTRQPELESHTWLTNDVLVYYGGEGTGDGGCFGGMPPYLELFANGKLFIWDWESGSDQIVSTKLSPTNICTFLNTVDQIGFLDYDPSTYFTLPLKKSPSILGAGGSIISVNSWKNKTAHLYAFESYQGAEKWKFWKVLFYKNTWAQVSNWILMLLQRPDSLVSPDCISPFGK